MAQTRKTSKNRKSGGMATKAAVVAGIGAACAVALGAVFRWRKEPQGDEDLPAPALKDGGAPDPVGNTGSVRPAGRGAMRDPPADWDEVDEAADGSFPASDPPNLAQHID